MAIQIKTFQISDKIYWGYQYKIPLLYALSISNQTIIDEIKKDMENFFNTHNLEYLKKGIDNLDLHICGDIAKDNSVVYVCTHDH